MHGCFTLQGLDHLESNTLHVSRNIQIFSKEVSQPFTYSQIMCMQSRNGPKLLIWNRAGKIMDWVLKMALASRYMQNTSCWLHHIIIIVSTNQALNIGLWLQNWRIKMGCHHRNQSCKNNIIKKTICKLIQNNNYTKLETFVTWKYNKNKMIFINYTCKILI